MSRNTLPRRLEKLTDSLKDNAGNQTAVSLLSSTPQTVSQGVSFTLHNLRPFNQPVATAITLVGFIYMIIFASIIAASGGAVRSIM